MTTANVEPHGDDARFAKNFKRVLDGLIGLRGTTDKQLILQCGMSRSTFFRKCGDGKWTGRDIDRLAQALQVSPEIFFQDADKIVPKNCTVLMEDFRELVVAA